MPPPVAAPDLDAFRDRETMSAASDLRLLPFEIRNAEGERIDAAWRHARGDRSPASSDPRSAPMVVIGHGVTSHWDRPWQTELSAALSHAGIASVLVSFAGNGASEGRFEDVTPTKEVADLGSVLDALQAWGVTRLMYAGHSMGRSRRHPRRRRRPHRVARLAGRHVPRSHLHAAHLRPPAVRG